MKYGPRAIIGNEICWFNRLLDNHVTIIQLLSRCVDNTGNLYCASLAKLVKWVSPTLANVWQRSVYLVLQCLSVQNWYHLPFYRLGQFQYKYVLLLTVILLRVVIFVNYTISTPKKICVWEWLISVKRKCFGKLLFYIIISKTKNNNNDTL